MRTQLKVNWNREITRTDLEPALRRYVRYIESLGFREQTIEMYTYRVRKYLEFSKTDQPSTEDFNEFRENLHDRKLARSTLNSFGFATKRYHEMVGNPVEFTFLKPNDTIPYFFNEDDIAAIFSVCQNLKHYAMLTTMFYGCLRVSELCSLNDQDIDFEAASIRIREGKGGREAIVPLKDEVAQVLRQYLKVRPSLKIDNEQPLFITDYCRRWVRVSVYRMFKKYKKLAGVTKPGGLHVFGRHSPASLMIKNGCDIMTVKEIMRHKDITTTARYLHISDDVKRQKFEQFLRV